MNPHNPAPRPGLFFQSNRKPRVRGVTLVELAISSTLLAIGMVAIFGSLLYSRKLSEGSVSQNAAITVVQGYIEQMKNMEFDDLPYITSTGTVIAGAGATSKEIPTRLSATVSDPLTISTATTLPSLSTLGITASTAITGVTENTKTIDVNSTPSDTIDDLRLNLRVWIQDISNPSISATQVRSITIQYAWQSGFGTNARIYRSSVRTIRSNVPTY